MPQDIERRIKLDQSIGSAMIAAIPAGAEVAVLTIRDESSHSGGDRAIAVELSVPGRSALIPTPEVLSRVNELVAETRHDREEFRVAEYTVRHGRTGWRLQSRFEY